MPSFKSSLTTLALAAAVSASIAAVPGQAMAKSLPNALSFNGIKFQGASFNGFKLLGIPNGIKLQGVSFNGATYQGTGANGINLNSIRLNGVDRQDRRSRGIETSGAFDPGAVTIEMITFPEAK